jgi:hypothetical protein
MRMNLDDSVPVSSIVVVSTFILIILVIGYQYALKSLPSIEIYLETIMKPPNCPFESLDSILDLNIQGQVRIQLVQFANDTE